MSLVKSLRSPLPNSTLSSINNQEDNPVHQSKLMRAILIRLKYDIQCLRFFSCFSIIISLCIILLCIISIILISSFQSVVIRLDQLQIWQNNITETGLGYKITMNVYNPNDYYFPKLRQPLMINEVEFKVSTFFSWNESDSSASIELEHFIENNSSKIILGCDEIQSNLTRPKYKSIIDLDEILINNKKYLINKENKMQILKNSENKLNLGEFVINSLNTNNMDTINTIYNQNYKSISDLMKDSSILEKGFGCFSVYRFISKEDLDAHPKKDRIYEILSSPQSSIGFKINGRAIVKHGIKTVHVNLNKKQVHFLTSP